MNLSCLGLRLIQNKQAEIEIQNKIHTFKNNES